MGALHRRRRRQHHPTPTTDSLLLAMLFILFAFVPSSSSAIRLAQQPPVDRNFNMQEEEGRLAWPRFLWYAVDNQLTAGSSRRLIGPGSSPPTCRSKCGTCTPCKPVHVPIQQGMSVPLEYYPEAWRCKCGNKLYMP